MPPPPEARLHPTINAPPPVAEAMRVLGELLEQQHRIAWALFVTDPPVLAFVEERADYRRPAAAACTSDNFPRAQARISETLRRAWDRDELGKRTEWLERALRAMQKLHAAGVLASATHARARGIEKRRGFSAPAPHTSEPVQPSLSPEQEKHLELLKGIAGQLVASGAATGVGSTVDTGFLRVEPPEAVERPIELGLDRAYSVRLKL